MPPRSQDEIGAEETVPEASRSRECSVVAAAQREERSSAGDVFRSDFSRQDATVMNVVRACAWLRREHRLPPVR